MKKALLVLASGVSLLVAAVPAQAKPVVDRSELVVALPDATADPPATGLTCGLVSLTDPTTDGGNVQVALVFGGPIVANSTGATISMTCTIQVGAGNSTHNGADACVVGPFTGFQATMVPPTFCAYLAPAGAPVFICTKVVINGVTHYWDSVNQEWSASSAVACKQAIHQELLPQWLRDLVEDLSVNVVDPILCPILGFLAPRVLPLLEVTPGEGDVYVLGDLVWDCPPYTT